MATAEDFGRNSFNVVIARILVTVAVFGTSLITARWLGPEGRGQYSLAILVGTVAVTVGGVIGPGGAYYAARGAYRRAQLFGTTVLLSFGSGLLAMLVCAAIFLPERHRILAGVPTGYVVLALAAIPFGILVTNIGNVLRGWEAFLPMNVTQVALAAIPLAILLPLVPILDHGRVWAAVGATTRRWSRR